MSAPGTDKRVEMLAQRVAAAHEREAEPRSQGVDPVPAVINSMMIRLTSRDSTEKNKAAWTEQEFNPTSNVWQNKSGGQTGTTSDNPAIEKRGNPGFIASASGDVVEATPMVDANGDAFMSFEVDRVFTGIVVNSAGDAGGGAGGGGNNCTFVYTVKTLDATVIGTSLTPTRSRIAGTEYENEANNFKCLCAWETCQAYADDAVKLLEVYSERPTTYEGCTT